MKKTIFLLCALFFLQNLYGKVRLPNIFSNDMVLQRNTVVKIWGWGAPNEKVTVKAEWQKAPVTVVTGADGKWMVKIKTTKEGGPYTIKISGENEIVLKNVLLGEVWICSGQSNMEYTIQWLGGWSSPLYSKDKEDFVSNDYSKMRFCQVTKAVSAVPLDTCVAKWFVPNLNDVENFSATAFYYGRELYKKLHVPIGLISTNWGGTPAEAWTDLKYLQNDDDLNYYLNLQSGTGPNSPANLYNAMINPWINYTIRGAIWYQGEANVDNSNLYNKLFTAMIKSWRDKWQIGDFPFYYVQIAPYNYGDEEQASAYLREAQTKTLSTSKNTGMAVTMDIGNPQNIHPKNKQDVGTRLALWALAKTYNVKVPAYSGPLYKNYKVEGDKIRIMFDYADKGLTMKGDKLTGFKIAGDDMKFIDADASIEKNNIVVKSDAVKKPAAVRYAFTNIDSTNLFNKDNLPATSFRTDALPFYKPVLSIRSDFDQTSNSLLVKINCADKKAELHYTTDGSEPVVTSAKYNNPIPVNKSITLTARAFRNGVVSIDKTVFTFKKHLAFGKPVVYKETFSPKYPGAKEYTLTDGVRGSGNFGDGYWQGFQQTNLDATIDLGEVKTINSVKLGVLKAIDSYIFPPERVDYYISEDGKFFIKIYQIENDPPTSAGRNEVINYTADFAPVSARYIKVVAQNQGIIPAWHPGKGEKAWLFADEIIVE